MHTWCFSFEGLISGGISAIMYNDPWAAVDITSLAFHLKDLDVFGMHNFLPPGTVLQQKNSRFEDRNRE